MTRLACGMAAVLLTSAAVSAQQPDVRSRRVQGNVWLIAAGGANVAAQI